MTADALVTYGQLKLFVGLADDSDQAVYEDAIDKASAIANMQTGRRLALRLIDEALDGNGSRDYLLSTYPVRSVESVHCDPVRLFGAGSVITNYYCDSFGRLELPFAAPEKKGILRVSYNAGYDVQGGEVPADLQEAVIEVAVWLRKRIGSNQIGLRSIAGGDGVVTTYETQIPLHAAKVFEAYRGPR